MSFDADVIACARIVEKGDPWRFRAAMAAPVAARAVLFPLYAFNIEVARAPWVTQEPMIAEMRLQWWRDVCEEIIEGRPVRRHEVATPLAHLLTPEQAQMLDELIALRRWDIYKDPFEDPAHFNRYIEVTAGHLAVVAAQALGAADAAVVRDAAFAAGLANWFGAIPKMQAAGRVPLIDGTPEAVAALAGDGMTRLARARAARSSVSAQASPAMLHLGAARTVLAQVAHDPLCVIEDRVQDLIRSDGFRFHWRAFTGRW